MAFNFVEFSSPGTHTVRATVFDGDGETELGTLTWEVTVSESAGSAPSTEHVSPAGERVEAETGEEVTFTVGASDPDGDVHRVVWWEGMCDVLLQMDDVTGASATSTVTTQVATGCPIFAWVIDETGRLTSSESWQIVARSSSQPPTPLEITKEGAESGLAAYEVTVDGTIEATDSFEAGGRDAIDGSTASGEVGPDGGSDRLQYTGEVTAFSLDGPAVVLADGEPVDPADL
jgi:hypothetical protein